MLYISSRPQYSSVNKTGLCFYKTKKMLGLTLIELIISTSITGIITAITLPNFNEFITKLRVDNEISRLSRLLSSARNHAINSGHNVVICPLGDDGSCSDNWDKELSVFIDATNNKRIDTVTNDVLITTKAAIKFGDTLIYGKRRTSITYKPTGQLSGLSNGTLKYCPKDHTDKSRGIVVARSGRFYATTDINGDGIDETRSKKVITCT